jgi:hypothetical protein
MQVATDFAAIRAQLRILCLRKTARQLGWPYGWPSDWRPRSVVDPRSPTQEFFTEAGAWEFIAELLDGDHPLKSVELREPPGRMAYVMTVDGLASQQLYIKLQLGSGKVIGRSFHYSLFGVLK